MSLEYDFHEIEDHLASLKRQMERFEKSKSVKKMKELEKDFDDLNKVNVNLRIELEQARTKIAEQGLRIGRLLSKLEEKNII